MSLKLTGTSMRLKGIIPASGNRQEEDPDLRFIRDAPARPPGARAIRYRPALAEVVAADKETP